MVSKSWSSLLDAVTSSKAGPDGSPSGRAATACKTTALTSPIRAIKTQTATAPAPAPAPTTTTTMGAATTDATGNHGSPTPGFQRGVRRRSSTLVGRLPSMPNYTKPVTFHYEIQNHTSRMQKITRAFAVYRLTAVTVGCVIVGMALGLVCRVYSNEWTERQFMYIEFPGELYLRFLKLLIVPLLVSNVILSFGSIHGKLSSHLGKIASLLYLMSNCLAIIVAISFVLMISPGRQSAAIVVNPHDTSNHNIITNNIGNNKTRFNTIDDFDDDHDSFLPEITIDEDFQHHEPEILPKILPNKQQQANPKPRKPNTSRLLPSSDTKINDQINQINSDQPVSNRESHQNQQFQPKTRPIIKPQVSISTFDLIRLPTTTTIGLDAINNQQDQKDRDNIVNHPSTTTSTTTKPKDREGVVLESNRLVSSSNRSDLNGKQQFRGLRQTIGTNLPIDILLDILRNLIPDNLVTIAMYQTKTRLLTPARMIVNVNGSTDPPPSKWPFYHANIEQANIIGLLVCSVLVGVVSSHMGEAGKPLLELCACISELSLRIGMMAINLTPICIMFLLIGQVARTRDLSSIVGDLCMYLVTVLTALIFHGFILMPAIYWVITRNMPIKFLQHQLDVLVASFATSSSSSTLALLLRNLIQYDLNPVIVRGFGPLGSVFNMNGTTIYEIIGCIFLAQKIGIDLPFSSILLIGLASAVAGLSTVGVPTSGMMTIVIVLDAINIPAATLSLIYIVDFIVDRFRTVVNVWTGSIIVALIDDMCPESLFDETREHNKFLEMWRTKTATKKASVKNHKMSIVGDTCDGEQPKSQVISVTITPPSDPTDSNV